MKSMESMQSMQSMQSMSPSVGDFVVLELLPNIYHCVDSYPPAAAHERQLNRERVCHPTQCMTQGRALPHPPLCPLKRLHPGEIQIALSGCSELCRAQFSIPLRLHSQVGCSCFREFIISKPSQRTQNSSPDCGSFVG
ncbi:hypothetical protein M758_6G072100 [Ceratodon purpureus]|nr:hypothetical protein M758_6G072100 [Ceratodon purpureus]